MQDWNPSKWLHVFGWLFFGTGVLSLMLVFAFTDATVSSSAISGANKYGTYAVPERVFNYHLAFQYLMAVLTSLGSCVVGALFLVGAELLKAFSPEAATSTPPWNKPADYNSMFRVGNFQIWTNAQGRAWADGLYFDTEREARDWANGKL